MTPQTQPFEGLRGPLFKRGPQSIYSRGTPTQSREQTLTNDIKLLEGYIESLKGVVSDLLIVKRGLSPGAMSVVATQNALSRGGSSIEQDIINIGVVFRTAIGDLKRQLAAKEEVKASFKEGFDAGFCGGYE